MNKIADKVYRILSDKCENYFGSTEETYDDWCKYLNKHKIETKDYDHHSDALNDLIEMIHLKNTNVVICDDPYSEIVDSGGCQLLIMPEEVAEKIAVLNGIP